MKVLAFLRSGLFEPLSSCSFCLLTMKVLFLLFLATAKRVGELQALFHRVAFRGPDLSLSYLPEFVVKTESVRNPLPRSFLVKSLEEFARDMPKEHSLPSCAGHPSLFRLHLVHVHFLCPQVLLRAPCPRTLSFFLRHVILDSSTVADSSNPCAHSVEGVATSAAFLHNWSVSRVLEDASWRSKPVSASFYLKDLSFCMDGCSSLGPFVAAGSVLP